MNYFCIMYKFKLYSNKTELLSQFLADAKIDVAIVTKTCLLDNNTKIVEDQFRGNFSFVSTTRNVSLVSLWSLPCRVRKIEAK